MTRFLSLLLLSALAATAQAADTAKADEATAAADAETTVVSAPEGEARPGAENCVRETGTRVKASKDEDGCLAQPGRSYSREELDRTGATTTADALRKLNTSGRSGH